METNLAKVVSVRNKTRKTKIMDPIVIVFIGIAIVLLGIIVFRLHAFLALLLASLVVGLLTPFDTLFQYAVGTGMDEAAAMNFAGQSLGKRIALAFGNTSAKIGILIAMASIIGTCLLKSGAADRIIRSALNFFGEKRSPLAFLSSGFILAIPVYADTVFYLLIPLGKSLGVRFPKRYVLYVMTIIAGTVMAHSLVPPTPGPLFVAEEIGVDLGTMMLAGLVVGIFTVVIGYLYALWANKRCVVPVRDTPDTNVQELVELSRRSSDSLPSLGWSLLPILLPIILIAGNTILNVTLADPYPSSWQAHLLSGAGLVGDSNIALLISALFSLLLMKRYVTESKQFREFVQSSLFNAGIIILITSAGGALGGMLQQSGVGIRVEELAEQYQIALIPFAFLVTAMVRTAQGSATVSMITAVGVLAGIANPETLGFHPVYIALAIGCGSKVVPWMYDSGFWIITEMSGMTTKEAIRYFSALLTIMGIAGVLFIMLLAELFPLV